MQTFNSLDELWLGAAKQIVDSGERTGSRNGATREVLGFVARLGDPRANFMFNPARKMSPSYAAGEMLWYLSGEDSIERIVHYAPSYERFADNGRAFGAYGHRWADGAPAFNISYGQLTDVLKLRRSTEEWSSDILDGWDSPPLKTQLAALISLLQKKPDTRQAVLTCWNAGDILHAYVGDKKDLPCTLVLDFIIRNDKLHLTVTMRSNDLWLGLPYDVFCFTTLQQIIATALEIELGWYQHQANSLHVYDPYWQRVLDARTCRFNTGPLSYGRHHGKISTKIAKAVEYEEFQRTRTRCHTLAAEGEFGTNTLLNQLLVMAALKASPSKRTAGKLTNTIMKKYVEANYVES